MISQIDEKLYSENDLTDQNFNVIGKHSSHIYYYITSISLPAYYELH
jgi:hypothetical protein